MRSVLGGLAAVLIGAAALGARPSPPPAPGAARTFLPAPYLESVGADVIPRDVVAALAQDRLGFLWIATGDGLVRYDGHEFRAQELDSPDVALRNLGWVRALLPARDGRLWIGTESQGLAAFDPADGRISLHPGRDAQAAGAAPDHAHQIQALAEDLDGTVWAGYRAGGLSRYDPASKQRIGYRQAVHAGSLPDDHVEALLVSRPGTLWVGTWQGLSRRAKGTDRFEPVFSVGTGSLAARHVTALFEAADGRIWAGTRQGDLALVDPATGRGQMLARGALARNGGAVTSLMQAPDGTLWVGRATGIELRSPQDGHLLQELRREAGEPGSLAADDVSSLLLDRAGWIWVGGIGVGLQRHNPNNRSISVVGVSPQPGARPREAHVRSLLQHDAGEIWISTAADGVLVMDAQLRVTGQVSLQQPQPGARALHADRGAAAAAPGAVVAMAQAGDGAVWLAADSTLYQVDRRRRVLRRVTHGAGATHCILAGRDGTLWVGTQDGLHRLPAGAPAFVRVAQAGGQPLSGDVYALAEAPDQSLWVGSVNGLLRIAPGGGELQAVASAPGQGLASPVVIGLLVDRQGGLWLDTAVAGLHRMTGWDGQRASFDSISKRHGMVGRPFGSNLLEDGRGRIWTHMHVYDAQGDRIDELTAIDGARLGNGRFGVHTKTTDGRLLFGGTKGLMVVRGESFDRSSFAPPLVVSALRVNGEARRTRPALDSLQLQAGERSFGVEFAALDFSNPKRIRYAYQLQGFDPDWINTGASLRVASYSNLAPGRYTLRVRATNSSGVWSAAQTHIDVQVLPAWWQTWPVRLAVLALALIAATAAWQLRTRALRRRRDQLEVMVRERTAALQTMSEALQERSAALQASSTTDPLTGLHNRRFLNDQIEAIVARSLRRHEAHQQHGAPLGDEADVSFFLVDIDHFKQVNDEHGHAAGDAVLRQISARLQQVFRASDCLVRWGGEEFLVVAVGMSRTGAAELAERVRLAVADVPFMLDDGAAIGQSCSVGFACLPLAPTFAKAVDWQDVVKLADAALYRVKATGRNGWMGVVSASAVSEAALRDWVRRPFDEWRATGHLTIVQSGTVVRDGARPTGS